MTAVSWPDARRRRVRDADTATSYDGFFRATVVEPRAEEVLAIVRPTVRFWCRDLATNFVHVEAFHTLDQLL